MTRISNAIQQRNAAPATAPRQSIAVMLNSLLDSEGYRKRFDDLLGRRAPQFVSSIVSMVNADSNLQEAFRNAPITVIQSALKAASFDLPIDTALGYAYVVPFKKYDKDSKRTRMEAQFILGYKGMIQLALRTGVYKTLNVVDVREGELKRYDRLTEEIELEFEEDDERRDALPIVGWVGYFRLVNGTEKTIYMTRRQIEAHERKHRKGQNKSWAWQDANFDSMARKTVLRRLIGGWGLMSIDYQRADAATLAAADAIAAGRFDDEDAAGANAAGASAGEAMPADYTVDADASAEDPELAALAAQSDREAQEAWEAEQMAMEVPHNDCTAGRV